MKKFISTLLAGLLFTGVAWATEHNETVIWNFVNGVKIAGVSLSQDGQTTLTNGTIIKDSDGLGTVTIARSSSGTVTLTCQDDDSNTAFVVASAGTGTMTVKPGGAGAMVLGSASATSIALTTDGGTVTVDGTITLPTTGTITGATSVTISGGSVTTVFDANGRRTTMPSTETITAAATITADACGTIKRITAAGPVTTNTTDTFTAPAAGNTGCHMVVCNVGSNTITLDNNAHFKSIGGADIALTGDDCTQVFSDGTVWRSAGSLVAN